MLKGSIAFGLGLPAPVRILAYVPAISGIMANLVSQDRPICLAFGQIVLEDMLSVRDIGCRPAFFPKIANEQAAKIVSGLTFGHDAVHRMRIHDNDRFSVADMDELVWDSQCIQSP